MTKNKRLFTLAICLIYMFSAAVFAAAEDLAIKVEDGSTGKLKVSGIAPSHNEGEVVTILVTNNEETLEAAQADFNKVQYQSTVLTGEGGKFEDTFTLYIPGATEAKTFKFYVGGKGYEGAEIESKSLWYAPLASKIVLAKAIIDKANSGESEALKEAGKIIENAENQKVFVIEENKVFQELETEKLAGLLKKLVDKDSFKGYEVGKEDEYREKYVAFESALYLAIALEGFNQGKEAVVVKDYSFTDEALLKIAEYIKSNGTLDYILNGKIAETPEYVITEEGKANAVKALFGKDLSSKEELQKLFAKNIILQGIKSNVKNGSGIIENILTDENIAAAGLNVPKYLALSDKSQANNYLYTNRASLNENNLQTEIENAAGSSVSDGDPETDSPSGDKGGFSVGGAVVAAPAEKFSDLGGYDWAKSAILALAEKNIINGVGGNMFNPAGTLTREAAAKIICLAVGIETNSTENLFADVSAGAWYAPYITALNKAGIINGVSDSAFGVGMNVTREDFAVMICRALSFSASKDASFTDKAAISAYAVDAVNALYERGIVGGYEDGSFKPKANITRAEGAKIIYGILSK